MHKFYNLMNIGFTFLYFYVIIYLEEIGGVIMKTKVCVITGAGGVICSAFAHEMAQNGYAVALIDINEEAAERCAAEVCMYGGLAKAYCADVLDRDELENVKIGRAHV